MARHTGPCGSTLDGAYACTKETVDDEHFGQHYDKVNEVQWRNEDDWCWVSDDS